MKLYTYFRSSASYRVRIALNLKGLTYESLPVHLTNAGGEQHRPEYRELNPEGLVPVLVDDDQHAITQSLAIMEYLEDRYPETPLLPTAAHERARVRSIALAIACDIHPLNNLRVLKYLTGPLGASEDEKTTWYRHWTESGLQAIEQHLAKNPATGEFCHGDQPTIADCCLIPQVFNAQRFDCDLSHAPTAVRIYEHCMTLDAFQAASPGRQPDAA